jgi:prepilin-type N-terminal cleavage/methylation domain-containing protein
MKHCLLKSQAGFSLLEVLVAAALTAIISVAVLELYRTQHQNYLTQEEISDVQQAGRASIDELARHIRMAGNGLPQGLPPLVAADANPDSITVTYRVDDNEASLNSGMGTIYDDLECADDISSFTANRWAYIFHPDSGGGEWFYITGLDVASKRIEHASAPLSHAYAAEAIILTPEQVTYYLAPYQDNQDGGATYLAMQVPGRPEQIYADDVSDLQFRYRLKNGLVVDKPVLMDDVREVLISLTALSSSDGDATERQHRTFTTSVNLRNLGS